ncbi:hypothetical protein [Pelotomaculum sp. FP]|uniref:SWIM zinc finger family protein n=1 Tax=Pelotomaculum sp. FP TaxID=261474 RepID=UPI001FA9B397|nr:hypothetical protein [Pelotomaculum sp. FP]
MDFEKYIDGKILARGSEYYLGGCVNSVDKKDKNNYIAVVAGTYDYKVTIAFSEEGDVLFSDCDCPYDMGPHCKHEIAVLYTLREMFKDDHAALTVDSPGKTTGLTGIMTKQFSPAKESPADRLARILSAQSGDKLVKFLISLALEYDEIGRREELEFGAGDLEEELRQCKGLIRSYIRQHSDRHGFVSYNKAPDAVQGGWMVLERAEQAATEGDYKRALELYLCVLHEMLPLLESADDSGGDVGSVINHSLTALAEMADSGLPAAASAYCFKKLLNEAANKIYDGWSDWRLSLLETCANLVNDGRQRKIFERQLNSTVEELNDSWSSRYLAERIAAILHRLILKFEGEVHAADFLEQNINFPLFREKAIEAAMANKDYDRVERLALEGEQLDRGMHGLINQWKKARYEAYRLSGQLDKRRNLAVEFILDGSFDYYKELKESYPDKEWASVYPGLIKALEEQKGYHDNYPSILIEEGEQKKLLEYVKARPAYITRYYQHLLPVFRNEVDYLFIQHILDEAQRAGNRKAYREICSLIRQFLKIGSSEKARQVVSQLLAIYPRKPAFKEELLKVKF